MINTILQATELFEIHQASNDQVNVPITVYENEAEYSNWQHTESESSSTSDESTDYLIEPDTSDPDYDPYSRFELKRSLKRKIHTRRESEGAGEIKNLFEPPKKYKLTNEEKVRNEIRKQRNRLSANKSRLKRIAREKCLEKEADELEKEHDKLTKEVTMLTKLKQLCTRVYESHLPNCKMSLQAPGVQLEVMRNKTNQSRVGEPDTSLVPQIKFENNYNSCAMSQTNSSSVLANDSYMTNVYTLNRCGPWSQTDQSKSARLDDKPIVNMMQADHDISRIKSEPMDIKLNSVSCKAERLESSPSSLNDSHSLTNTYIPTTSNCLFNFMSASTTLRHADKVENTVSQRNTASNDWTGSSMIYNTAQGSASSPQTLLCDNHNETKKQMAVTQYGLQTVLNDLNILTSIGLPNVEIPYPPVSVIVDGNQARKHDADFNLDEITFPDFNDDVCHNADEQIGKIKSYLLEGFT